MLLLLLPMSALSTLSCESEARLGALRALIRARRSGQDCFPLLPPLLPLGTAPPLLLVVSPASPAASARVDTVGAFAVTTRR